MPSSGVTPLVSGPSYQFSVPNFVSSSLYKSILTKSDDEKKAAFVANVNEAYKLWSTINVVRRSPHYRECTVYLQMRHQFGDLTHSGPWPLQVGDCIHVLPPLEVSGLVNRHHTASPACYKLHHSDSALYVYPILVSETEFEAFYKEWTIIHIGRGVAIPVSNLGRILGAAHIDAITDLSKFRRPVAMIVAKQDVGGNDNQVLMGDRITVKWLNR